MKNYVFFLLIVIVNFILAQSGNVGINENGALPHPSAMLDISSTSKGLLIPRMSAAQRISITSPAHGLLVFDLDSNCMMYYNAFINQWKSLCGGSGGNGHNGLFATSNEPAGPNCPYGGIKVEFGIDLNDNNILEPSEVIPSLTRYVCHGEPGPVGCNNTNFVLKSNGSTATCSQIFDNGTNVGIGITNPTEKLHVQGSFRNETNAFLATSSGRVGIGTTNPLHKLHTQGSARIDSSTFLATNSGNVGIGTTNPSQKLHVVGNARITSIASGANGAIVTSNSAGDLGLTNFSGNNTEVLLGNGTWSSVSSLPGGVSCNNTNYVLKSNGSQGVCSQIFDNGTNVGIGITSPTEKLHVQGSLRNETNAFLATSSGRVGIGTTNPLHKLHTQGSARIDSSTFLATNSGNVGIGTTTPAQKLHVVGNARIT
ncbi:MAG: hypothetical protein N2Z72_01715, partial [Bacteroidales bacterium]|nr:hypothetical protein [Bacteroidales bacterium]